MGEGGEIVALPYTEGFDARLAGAEAGDVPYEEGTVERALWLDGWRDQDHHLKARDDALNTIGWFG